MPLVDNKGHSSAGFDVMCRHAALRRPKAMHPQMIVHRRRTLWPAPSQMERRPQAARRRLRRRAVIFRLGVRTSLEGPPGLARYETLVNAEEQETTTQLEFDALIPTEEALRYFTYWATHQWLQIQYGATRLRFL